ncbi:hypothetical protein AB7W58_03130 [Providencia rettgeri]
MTEPLIDYIFGSMSSSTEIILYGASNKLEGIAAYDILSDDTKNKYQHYEKAIVVSDSIRGKVLIAKYRTNKQKWYVVNEAYDCACYPVKILTFTEDDTFQLTTILNTKINL